MHFEATSPDVKIQLEKATSPALVLAVSNNNLMSFIPASFLALSMIQFSLAFWYFLVMYQSRAYHTATITIRCLPTFLAFGNNDYYHIISVVHRLSYAFVVKSFFI